MLGVTRGERIYFGIVALAALFVAYLEFFEPGPAHLDGASRRTGNCVVSDA
jgi:hypothetical protein